MALLHRTPNRTVNSTVAIAKQPGRSESLAIALDGSLYMSRFVVIIFAALILLAAGGFYKYGRFIWVPAVRHVSGDQTVKDIIAMYGVDTRDRLAARFKTVGLIYPPSNVTFLATKDNAKLELWVGPPSAPTYVHTYPILALSGSAGPKLREGDRQVPEGIYSIEGLNPNSSYHLSLKINYPNKFDLHHARAEGRNTPGTNIFIHGKSASIGCLAMGDPAVEEIFILAADVGRTNVELVIAPTDPRIVQLQPLASLSWTIDLYNDISDKFALYIR